MDPVEVKAQLANLRTALQTFEERLAPQDVPLEIISDFKSSVDDLRLRLWGLLTSRNADDQIEFQHRFRLRRAREMCLQLGAELRAKELHVDREELHRLVLAARGLVAAAEVA